jgi:hypothetical protein
MLLSRQHLRQLLGLLWLIDGLLQLQPQMWTMNMVNGIMKPMLAGQPQPIERNLQWIVQVTTQHLVLVNLLICVVQMAGGLALLLGRRQDLIKATLILSIGWAFVVWYGGEGMSMLLTGQGSALTGAPGAVLLYALLALAVYPRAGRPSSDDGIVSRQQLQLALGAFWILMAALQAQSFWWVSGQISQVFGGDVGAGGLNGTIVDPVLRWLVHNTANIETPLNIALILVFLALGVALLIVKPAQAQPMLAASIVVSLVLWYFFEALGMIFSGMATDFNSGLPLVLVALACWPRERVAVARQHSEAIRPGLAR